jgi:hypothetical protein
VAFRKIPGSGVRPEAAVVVWRRARSALGGMVPDSSVPAPVARKHLAGDLRSAPAGLGRRTEHTLESRSLTRGACGSPSGQRPRYSLERMPSYISVRLAADRAAHELVYRGRIRKDKAKYS